MLMIFFDQTRRFDHIRVLDRIDNLLGGNMPGGEFFRIYYDVEFTSTASGHCDGGNSGQPRKSRPNSIGGNFSKSREVARIGRQAIGEDRENRKSKSFNMFYFRCRRKLKLGQTGLYQLKL